MHSVSVKWLYCVIVSSLIERGENVWGQDYNHQMNMHTKSNMCHPEGTYHKLKQQPTKRTSVYNTSCQNTTMSLYDMHIIKHTRCITLWYEYTYTFIHAAHIHSKSAKYICAHIISIWLHYMSIQYTELFWMGARLHIVGGGYHLRDNKQKIKIAVLFLVSEWLTLNLQFVCGGNRCTYTFCDIMSQLKRFSRAYTYTRIRRVVRYL